MDYNAVERKQQLITIEKETFVIIKKQQVIDQFLQFLLVDSLSFKQIDEWSNCYNSKPDGL